MAKKKSEFLSSFGTSFQVFKSITDAVLAEGGSDDDLRSLLSDPDKCRRVALEIIERPREQTGSPYRGGPPSGQACDRITVPSLSAAELVALAKSKLKLTFLDEAGFAGCDFVRDEGGKTYEVMVWSPGRLVSTVEVRRYFPKDFTGNVAAFIVWLTAQPLKEGRHVSIPEALLNRYPEDRFLFAPRFECYGSVRRLVLLGDVFSEWSAGQSFVAFREFNG